MVKKLFIQVLSILIFFVNCSNSPTMPTNEGSIESPKSISTDVTQNGTVAENGISYYCFKAPSTGCCTVHLTGLQTIEWQIVAQDSTENISGSIGRKYSIYDTVASANLCIGKTYIVIIDNHDRFFADAQNIKSVASEFSFIINKSQKGEGAMFDPVDLAVPSIKQGTFGPNGASFYSFKAISPFQAIKLGKDIDGLYSSITYNSDSKIPINSSFHPTEVYVYYPLVIGKTYYFAVHQDGLNSDQTGNYSIAMSDSFNAKVNVSNRTSRDITMSYSLKSTELLWDMNNSIKINSMSEFQTDFNWGFTDSVYLELGIENSGLSKCLQKNKSYDVIYNGPQDFTISEKN